MHAIISDIQKFSLHDGPGIRTTVFFKGCNMRCVWCHNPETFLIRPDILFYSSKCIGCECCYNACNTGALTKNIKRLYKPDLCSHCGICAEVCAPQALKVVGKKMTVDEIMSSIMTDKDYYSGSGGGVTLSGGEVLLQNEFAAELLQECCENGIDTAIESNLSFPFEKLNPILPYLNRIYCDVKIYNDEMHVKWTGVSNRNIFSNLKKLREYSIPIVVRTPVIPGYTDDEENIRSIAEWLRDNAKIEYYELLNYNPLAEAKNQEMGMKYIPGKLRKKTKAEMMKLKKIASESGINVVIGEE